MAQLSQQGHKESSASEGHPPTQASSTDLRWECHLSDAGSFMSTNSKGNGSLLSPLAASHSQTSRLREGDSQVVTSNQSQKAAMR